jgi:hypothetical protein
MSILQTERPGFTPIENNRRNYSSVCLKFYNKKPTKARISRSTDGKENVEMLWTRSKDGFGKKTKISAGGRTRRRKRKRQT